MPSHLLVCFDNGAAAALAAEPEHVKCGGGANNQGGFMDFKFLYLIAFLGVFVLFGFVLGYTFAFFDIHSNVSDYCSMPISDDIGTQSHS
ncbi:hypothetical protein [Shewanella algae]|uniref:hypothetical protein n=1 Tax=Shewanella algae TaxID=38313 RepID=UPI0023592BF9|nr:hypothetical protein [Shewanella algae]MDC8852766.1 hypothetical protein [Shewanella algae]